MSSSYTSNSGIELIPTGAQVGTWGSTTNTNFQIIDRAVNGVGTIALTGTTYSLDTSDGALSEGQYNVLVFTGTPGGTCTVTINPSDQQKTFFINNSSDQNVVLTQGSGGNVTIAAGKTGIVYADGQGSIASVTNVTDSSNLDFGIDSTQTLWVSTDGDDTNNGYQPYTPFRTLAQALSVVAEGGIINVAPGTYTEVCPMVVPRNVSIVGASLRVTQIQPTSGTSTNDMFLVDSGAYLTGMTFAGHQAGAWAVRFNASADNTGIGAADAGAYILKSPYIQNCTSYTAQDDSGVAGSTSDGTTGGGMLVDGDECASNSPIRSMVVDSYTQINLDGPGCLVTNNAYAQLVSFFGTFCSYHVKATNGGQVNLSNSTTDFGTQGIVADGKSPTAIYTGTASAQSADENNFVVTALTTNTIGSSNRPAQGQVLVVDGNTYTITGAAPATGGYTVTFYPTLSGALSGGETVSFYQRSQVSTSGHTMEYVGAGTNYLALPFNGGEPIPANEIVELNGGRVFYSSTDQLGNFRVGQQFSVNGTTGEVTINTDSFNVSGLNAIGPFSRDGGQTSVGVQLLEVSNNTDLNASTGVPDGNTAPTQYAVTQYLETNYTTSAELATVATSGLYSDLSGTPTLATVATSGLYSDLTGTPTLATVATSGLYSDLSGTPTLYDDAAVDSHLNTSTATTGQVLSWTGADYDWVDGGASSAYTTTSFTATASQTTFNVSYTVGQVEVYFNGARLSASEYTATDGSTITLNVGATAGDIIDVVAWTVASVAPSAAYTKTSFTATASQTTFSVTYTVGYVDVYLNGAKLGTADYTASNGTSVVLGTGATVGDLVEIIAWNIVGVAETATEPGMELLAVETVTTSVNAVDFTLPSGYSRFRLILNEVNHTGTSPALRVSFDGGSTFVTTGGYANYCKSQVVGSTTSVTSEFYGNSGATVTTQGEDNLNFFIDCTVNATSTTFAGQGMSGTSGTAAFHSVMSASVISPGTPDVLRVTFFSGSNTYDSGTFALYGYKESI